MFSYDMAFLYIFSYCYASKKHFSLQLDVVELFVRLSVMEDYLADVWKT